MSDILFIKTSSLGDVIHHMPAVSDARAHRPQARIGWVVEEAFAPLVRLHRAVDSVIPVASRRWRRAPFSRATWREVGAFRSAMRAQTHETVIDAQGLVRSALIARFARGRRHGYDRESVRERAAAWFYDAHYRVDRSLHAITRNRALTAQVLGYAVEGPVDFGLDRAVLAQGETTRDAILLHATARPEKEWRVDDWIAIARALAARGYRPVLPWGTERERKRSVAIATAVSAATVPERAALDSVARMIARAALVVGVDTGLLHLAAALGVPLVAIFAGTMPQQHGPLGTGRIEIIGASSAPPTLADVSLALERILS
ncbi:MAG: lipopolysaccharide heptosyltransferase I [Alphaproteobacteria bacterium]|nr:lipopolysaccharide heptosyltransferase I [Alphaproteobacteria bacterium]